VRRPRVRDKKFSCYTIIGFGGDIIMMLISIIIHCYRGGERGWQDLGWNTGQTRLILFMKNVLIKPFGKSDSAVHYIDEVLIAVATATFDVFIECREIGLFRWRFTYHTLHTVCAHTHKPTHTHFTNSRSTLLSTALSKIDKSCRVLGKIGGGWR